jgi:hypothetical protein
LGFSGYQPFIRAYVGQGLRRTDCSWVVPPEVRAGEKLFN